MRRTINDLSKDESAQISSFENEAYAVRLLSVGIRPECEITLVRRSPLRDALYVKVGSQFVALRKKEAQSIYIYQ